MPRFHRQVAVVPIMSSVLHWRDTTILIIAVLGNITGQFLTSFSKSMGVLYFAYVLWMLWNTITTISRYTSSIFTMILLSKMLIARSSITKFMESNEVGKAFSVLGILQSLFPFVTKPFFSFLYKMTLEDFPGAFRVLTGSLYIFVLLLLIYTHFGMKKQERENKNEQEHLGEEMVHLNNDK